MIQFQWWWMVVIAPLPWLLARLPTPMPAAAREPDNPPTVAIRVPFYQLARSAVEPLAVGRSTPDRMRKVLFAVAWLTLVAGAMRPQWIGEPIAVAGKARDLLLAIDISPSMQETDLILNDRQVSRLRVVKQVVSDFLKARSGDRVGLILFGAQPYVQAPLTHDTQTVGQLLKEADLGMAGNATAIGDAMGLAIKRLRNRPAASRVLILLTDGANTGGEVAPERAAELAAEAGVKIYTIGIGADEVLRRSLFGMRRENPSADLDEALLQSIASRTGGAYFRARSTGELELIYEQINQLEPVEQKERFYRPVAEYYWLPALLATGALLVLRARGEVET